MRPSLPALYLCAADPAWAPDAPDSVLSRLAALGLIHPDLRVPGVEDALCAGPDFMVLVTFLGCSPSVMLEPDQAGGATCFVRQHLYPDTRFISQTRSVRARCPHCRAAAAPRAGAHAHDERYTCGNCGHGTDLSALDWRHSAGYGRWFLEIAGVHPHEAVPSDRLLDCLRDVSATDWNYFYAG